MQQFAEGIDFDQEIESSSESSYYSKEHDVKNEMKDHVDIMSKSRQVGANSFMEQPQTQLREVHS